MVKIWAQESADWRLTMERNGDSAPMSLRAVGPDRALVMDLGRDAPAEAVRRGAAKAVRAVRELGAQSLLLDMAPLRALGADGLAAAVQGAELACYQQESWKEREDKPFTLYVAGTEGMDAEAVLRETDAVTRAVCFARDLTNRPGNLLTPDMMAQAMAQAAQRRAWRQRSWTRAGPGPWAWGHSTPWGTAPPTRPGSSCCAGRAGRRTPPPWPWWARGFASTPAATT